MPRSGFGPRHCRAVGDFAVEAFGRLLEERAAGSGGALSADDIHALGIAFRSAPGRRMKAFLAEAYDGCSRAREAARQQEKRRNGFHRLVVHTFSHLFGEPGADVAIGRDILPAFFLVLKTMLGEEAIQHNTELCNLIIDDLWVRHGDAFDWELFFEDARAKRLLVRALNDIARQFEDFERRRKWFIDMMAFRPTDGSAPGNGRPGSPDAAPPVFTERHFLKLMGALFTPFEPDRWTRREDDTATFFNERLLIDLIRFEDSLGACTGDAAASPSSATAPANQLRGLDTYKSLSE